ncbi:MAG: DUF4331 family protein, partial [Umezawaea sp.]
MAEAPPLTRRRRTRGVLAAAGATLLIAAVDVLVPGSSVASSHREAPLISADPSVDNTDLYAFVAGDQPDFVTVIANYYGFQEPNGGPNFYPWATDAHYDINIDNDGNSVPDLTYRLTFKTEDKRGADTFLYNNGVVSSLDDENLLFRQTY